MFEKLHQPFLLWWSNPEQELLNKLLREDIERAIDGLQEAFRTVLILVEVNGQSYAEVADMLGLPIGTVRSRLNRARSHLQRAAGLIGRRQDEEHMAKHHHGGHKRHDKISCEEVAP